MLILAAIAAIGCGKKGPPLAPYARVPAPVAGVTSQRVGSDVYLSFPVPAANADGQEPADLQTLEVYAVTATKAPQTEEQRKVATLVATLPVQPILPELPVPADGTPPPPLPVPPGVPQGATAVVREPITAETRVPIELPSDAKPLDHDMPTDVVEPIGPLVAPAPTELPRRHYFVIGISPRGRKSEPSAQNSVPLESGSSAPGELVVTNTETTMTITWTPPADARSSAFLVPAAPSNATPATPALSPPAKPPAAPGVALPAAKPTVAPGLPPLPAKSLGFPSEATTYHLYDVPTNASPEDPFAITVPSPMTPQPIAGTTHVIPSVTFGVERCFEVRPVDQVAGATVIGPASPRTCFTAKDTFPPAAPKRLESIAGAGFISLVWEPNSEADLAGYLVLRGEAPGDTLQAVTKEPWTTTIYRDETVKPGTRYVYAVVAVDRAQNLSPQSNRAEETARQ